jgi:hypothetical protein
MRRFFFFYWEEETQYKAGNINSYLEIKEIENIMKRRNKRCRR